MFCSTSRRAVSSGSVPPACEKIQRMSGYLVATPLNRRKVDRARRVGDEFDRGRPDARQDAAAAVRRGRVHVDQRLAPVEFGIDRIERRVAEILVAVAREQADAVGLERVEGVFDFLQAAVGVGRRDGGEQAEAAGVVGHHPRAVFVALAPEPARQRHVVGEPGARLHQRDDRGRDSALVHVVERHLRRPSRRTAAAAPDRHHVGVERRDVVVVDVDPGPGRRRLRLRQHGRRAERGGAPIRGRDAAGEEAPAANASPLRSNVGSQQAQPDRSFRRCVMPFIVGLPRLASLSDASQTR